ncbi:TerC family protein [Cognatiluteimonas profundi]|uniref:TerC family protein n=1 Tax=Cognatiluteimonas profundi TaxID=2594501 RepID=UPI00131D68D3|nr:TerC family protein [Lysobacter profundi]
MSLAWVTDPQIWIALVTLSTLEIVLGVDNLVFISIAVSKLPPAQRSRARRFGIALACVSRIGLLVSLAYLARMQTNLFTLFGLGISIRDLVLILGGVFLVVKGTMEIRDLIVGEEDAMDVHSKPAQAVMSVILQIAIIDIVFSLDSVITAVGMVSQIPVMVAAILVSVVLMLFAANALGEFIDRNPTIKMLALTFIVLVGVVLIADGFSVHIGRGYVYVAMAFSAVVESLNLWAKRRQRLRSVED